jgi:hypothetical protein
MTVFSISNSFINKNKLEFIEIDEKSATYLITGIIEYTIDISYEYLTSRILDRYLFRNVSQFNVFGNNIYDIEYDLFKDFSRLNQILFFIDSLKQFFHSNKNKWMHGLRYSSDIYDIDEPGVKYNPKLFIHFNEKKSDFKFYEIYKYPEEDFCLFSHFPHNKLIYPLFDTLEKINCSCTLLWLMKYSKLYVDFNRIFKRDDYIQFKVKRYINVSTLFCLFEDRYNEFLFKCKFDNRRKLCNATSFNLNETNSLNEIPNNIFVLYTDEDVINLIQLSEYILLVILNPIFAFFGLLTNLMVVIVIYNFKNLKTDKKTDMKRAKDNMFKHILIHSIFNVIYCFIMAFKPINECLIFTSSLFCSSIFTFKSAQYFKIIFIEFLGNIAKTCSNSSYVAITLSRIAFISNKSKRCFRIFENLNTKLYLFLIIAFSSLLSTFKLFEFKINRFENTQINENDFPTEKKNLFFCSQPETHLFECEILGVLEIINNIINDILFFILTIILDLMVLKGITNMIKNKKKLVENFKKQEEKKKRNRIQKMIVINCLIYIISHSPELTSSIILLIYENEMQLCVKYFRCDKLNELAQFFIYFPIIFQFFINKKFNSLFKESYNKILFNIKMKLTKKNDQ